MIRGMRRKNQELPAEAVEDIMQNETSGVLAVLGDDGYPYAVPMSYVYTGGAVYFHSAKEGNKVDAVKRDHKASFCVVAQDEVIPERFTTHYMSVMAFGDIDIVTDEAERRNASELLAAKYNPCATEEERDAEIDGGLPRMEIIKLTVEHITGKQSRELAEAKDK